MKHTPGQILDGKYQLDREIGRGRMGVVFAATRLSLRDRVAIKILMPGTVEAEKRFFREALAGASIKSQHIAQVFEFAKHDDGSPNYIVMEYLDGLDLSRYLARHRRCEIEEAVEIVLQACEALSLTHARGVVHRDLKPANLFRVNQPDGRLLVKVLDFGIAKASALTESGAPMTETTAFIGTPLYAAPEQWASARDVDGRADIWAIGVVLYELLAGRPPFDATNAMELALQVTTSNRPRLRNLRPDVPMALETVVDRCLQRNPDDRYQNVRELAAALSLLVRSPTSPPVTSGEYSRAQLMRVAALGTGAAALLFGAAFLADWSYYAVDPYGPGRLAIGRICGALLAFAAAAAGLVIAIAERIRKRTFTFLLARDRSTAVFVAISAFVLIAGMLTNPRYRAENLRLISNDECVVNNESGQLLKIGRNDAPIIVRVGTRAECTQGGNLNKLSWFGSVNTPKTIAHPSAVVRLRGIAGSTVRISLQEYATETVAGLSGITDGPTLDAKALGERLSISPNSLERARLVLGYPMRRVRVQVDGTDLGTLLVHAGLAKSDPLVDQEYKTLEDDARHDHRGVWQVDDANKPTTTPPSQTELLRIVVQRNRRRAASGKFGYFYRFEAHADSLAAIETIRVESHSRGGTLLNGPIAYKRCGTSKWGFVTDDIGPLRNTCDTRSLTSGCECRLVLTSNRCAPINSVWVTFKGRLPFEVPINACSALGERPNGSVATQATQVALISTPGGEMHSVEVGSAGVSNCEPSCGPPPAFVDEGGE